MRGAATPQPPPLASSTPPAVPCKGNSSSGSWMKSDNTAQLEGYNCCRHRAIHRLPVQVENKINNYTKEKKPNARVLLAHAGPAS